MPIIKRQVERLGVAQEARELLEKLEPVALAATPSSGNAPQGYAHALTSLSCALGALSLKSLVTALSKAEDTPEWLKSFSLEK